jgi:hypothetical protein
MKYSSNTVIPEAVADLLSNPVAEEQLLGEILKHLGDKSFTTKVGDKNLTVSTVSPAFDSADLEAVLSR